MSLFTSINLSELPPPRLIEEIDYETILAATKAELKNLAPDFPLDSLRESDPMSKLLEVIAYREMHLRQRINEAARGLMLATAKSADLDNLVALFNIVREQTDPGEPDASPPIPPTFEDDETLRKRAQSVFNGFSTAGPRGAYIFHARRADSRVKDVAVYSEKPGEVDIRILARRDKDEDVDDYDGRADPDLIAAVEAVLNDDDVRPITDFVTVSSANITKYTVSANLILYPGVGKSEVVAATEQALQQYMSEHHALGVDITRAGLFAAAYGKGVQNLELLEPSADIFVDRGSAAYGQIGVLNVLEYPISIPTQLASSIRFDGIDRSSEEISGDVSVGRPENEYDIQDYVLYWGVNNAGKLPCGTKAYTFSDKGSLILDHSGVEKLNVVSEDGRTIYVIGRDFSIDNTSGEIRTEDHALYEKTVRISYQLKPIAVLSKNLESLVYSFPVDTRVPLGASHLLIFTRNDFGEMLEGLSVSIYK